MNIWIVLEKVYWSGNNAILLDICLSAPGMLFGTFNTGVCVCYCNFEKCNYCELKSTNTTTKYEFEPFKDISVNLKHRSLN